MSTPPDCVRGEPGAIETLRIGTRGSPLALWQAELVEELLRRHLPDLRTEIVSIRSSGELFPERALETIGVGVFTREIDRAVLDGRVDIGVHSLKDVPTELPGDLVLAAVPERGPCHDAWVSAGGTRLADLPRGARVGTSSPRRAAQLRARRPDLAIVPLRGNVETRLRKVAELGLAGTVLAEAGLRRLGRGDVITERVAADWIVPAVGQGAVAIVASPGRRGLLELLRVLEHRPSRARVDAERAFLRTLRGGCQVPAGALAAIEEEGEITIEGVLCSASGDRVLRGRRRGAIEEAAAVGRALAEELLGRGGGEILASARSAAPAPSRDSNRGEGAETRSGTGEET